MPQLCPLPIFLSHILVGLRAPNSIREIAVVYFLTSYFTQNQCISVCPVSLAFWPLLKKCMRKQHATENSKTCKTNVSVLLQKN
jgi:hypothetical protein